MTAGERAVHRLAVADKSYKALLARSDAARAARAERVVACRAAGVTYRVIAATLGMSVEAVQKILRKVATDE